MIFLLFSLKSCATLAKMVCESAQFRLFTTAESGTIGHLW
jgi:hypothetical protein